MSWYTHQRLIHIVKERLVLRVTGGACYYLCIVESTTFVCPVDDYLRPSV
ncbi:hypothetical protein vBKpnPEKp2_052 [Klebsiella phage vB_KpnP_EKp2]|uniref:Uncharacterized protein n=1 Tax=Klebsiella phage vB_KpnP_EKp2 TaxID=3065243 RepID=A0AAX4G4D3_9CAUD|nr:hypothetical protein vBKpnPEKp2_052 [Klebsiella phage vB_KpnP_EKp2]